MLDETVNWKYLELIFFLSWCNLSLSGVRDQKGDGTTCMSRIILSLLWKVLQCLPGVYSSMLFYNVDYV